MFKHKTSIEIRFVDLDAFGHVNNANYLSYFENARVKYFDEIVGWKYDWSKQGIILARAEINFVSPVHFRDNVFIQVRCSRIGTKSFDLEYKMIKIENGKEQLMADGISIMVTYDYEKNKSIEVPKEWKEAILKFEGVETL